MASVIFEVDTRALARAIRVRMWLIGKTLAAACWLLSPLAGRLFKVNVAIEIGINDDELQRRVKLVSRPSKPYVGGA